MVSFYQVILGIKRKHGSRFKKFVLLGSFMVLVYLILFRNTFAEVSNYNGRSSDMDARSAGDVSIFHWIEKRQKKAITRQKKTFSNWRILGRSIDTENDLLINWDYAPLAEKCRYMIDATYALNEAWSNENIVKFYGDDQVDNVLISLMAERLRMFDHCFIAGELESSEVFGLKSFVGEKYDSMVSLKDYIRRLFPFMHELTDDDDPLLWPQITNLRTGHIEPVFRLPNNFNQNFFLNWKRMARGSGIVITLSEGSKSLLYKQLKVLEHSGNTLPIQIVTAGNDFSDEFKEELREMVANSKQNVFLVDCSPLLNSQFAKEHIKNVLNKWIAVIFNTFEEPILLDVDAVPFVPMERFLAEKRYKESGMLMYKDRNMPGEHTSQYCIEMLGDVEPSIQEKKFIGSRIKYHSRTKSFDQTEEAAAYQGYFRQLKLHHVESGLVVINKSEKLSGLLLSFLMNLDAKMKKCVYGDKEIFWLGQLYAGQSYAIYPTDGGVAGPLTRSNHETFSLYQICATQIAHIDESQDLLWTNGGLKTCKFEDGAESDFKDHPDYFGGRYHSVETLKSIYGSPLNIEGLIIPKVEEDPWIQIQECHNYMYCATYKEDTQASTESERSKLAVLDQSTKSRVDSIVFAWNQ